MTVAGVCGLILKVLTCLVSALLPLGILIRDWKFHDKRTKAHHEITRGILIIWVITSLVAVAFVCQETYHSFVLDKKVGALVSGNDELLARSKAAERRLSELKDFLEPVISRAVENYPGLTEREVHGKLASLYSPRERLSGLLARVKGENLMADSDVVRILVLSKQLIEFRQERDLYPVLHFWCEWCLSLSPSQSYTCARMLTEMTRVLLRDEKDFPQQMCDLVGMEKLRAQFIRLFESERLPTFTFTSYRLWKWTATVMIKDVLNKPIEVPSEFATMDNPIGRLYADVCQETKKQHPDNWTWWFVTKLWLADDAAPNQAATQDQKVSLVVQTSPRVRMVTDLVTQYRTDAFDSP